MHLGWVYVNLAKTCFSRSRRTGTSFFLKLYRLPQASENCGERGHPTATLLGPYVSQGQNDPVTGSNKKKIIRREKIKQSEKYAIFDRNLDSFGRSVEAYISQVRF